MNVSRTLTGFQRVGVLPSVSPPMFYTHFPQRTTQGRAGDDGKGHLNLSEFQQRKITMVFHVWAPCYLVYSGGKRAPWDHVSLSIWKLECTVAPLTARDRYVSFFFDQGYLSCEKQIIIGETATETLRSAPPASLRGKSPHPTPGYWRDSQMEPCGNARLIFQAVRSRQIPKGTAQ